jgi:hypothetical protein
MKAKKKVMEIEISAGDLESAVEMIKKAVAGTKPVSFEICAKYDEGEED